MNLNDVPARLSDMHLHLSLAQSCIQVSKKLSLDPRSINVNLYNNHYFIFVNDIVRRYFFIEMSKLVRSKDNEKHNVFRLADNLREIPELRNNHKFEEIIQNIKFLQPTIDGILDRRDSEYAHADMKLENLSFEMAMTKREIANYEELISKLWEYLDYLNGYFNGSSYVREGIDFIGSLEVISRNYKMQKPGYVNLDFELSNPEVEIQFNRINHLSKEKKQGLVLIMSEYIKSV